MLQFLQICPNIQVNSVTISQIDANSKYKVHEMSVSAIISTRVLKQTSLQLLNAFRCVSLNF